MKETLLKIENIKKNGYHFSFGEIIELTFENYKKIAGIQGLVFLCTILIFTVVIGSVAGLAVGIGSLTEYFTDIDVNEVSSVALLVTFGVTVILSGLSAPFTAGLLKMAHDAAENREVEFSTAFEYYKAPYFSQLFTVGVLIAMFSSGLDTIFGLIEHGFLEGFPAKAMGFVSFILTVLIAILTLFAIPLVSFGNLTATDAIKGSIAVVKQNFWTIIGIQLIAWICTILGIFGFCIGIFFTMPLLYATIYVMYRTAIGIEEKSEINEIGVSQF